MALPLLYVARDSKVTVVSRARLRMAGAERVRRNWHTLVEVTAPALRPQPPRVLSDAVLVVLAPVLAGSITTAFVPLEVGIAVGGATCLATSYLAPVLRRRVERRPRRGLAEVRLLSAQPERTAFQQAVELADRIADTWPALGPLIDPADAEPILAEALWEIAGLLTRRQELTAVLADLTRPDFAAVSATDQTARELRSQVQATKTVLAQVNADVARRQANLRRAEEAGRQFVREQEMLRAIRAAEDSLRSNRPANLPTLLDPAADLAEHTQSVLVAYRELTAGIHSDPPLR